MLGNFYMGSTLLLTESMAEMHPTSFACEDHKEEGTCARYLSKS